MLEELIDVIEWDVILLAEANIFVIMPLIYQKKSSMCEFPVISSFFHHRALKI